jgi:hypothetical protein
VTRRLDQLPTRPTDLWRTVRSVQREASERASQLLSVLRRTDGSQAMALGSGWTWYDQAGTAVLAEDAVAGVGLALPYLAMASAPARYTDWPTSTSATFEDIHRFTVYKQQAYASISVGHTSDVAATTGEAIVTVNGTQVGSTISVTFSQAATTIGPFALPGAIRGQVEIRVQARRTGGAGGIRTAVLAASQIQA